MVKLQETHVQLTCFNLLSYVAKLSCLNNVNILLVLRYSNFSKVTLFCACPCRNKWEGRTGKYLARGHGVRTERSEVRAP